MKKVSLFLTILGLNMLCLSLHAVPANPRPHPYVQPDGDTLTVRLFGDERRHWRTTEDGVLIAINGQDYYCYAYVNSKGETVPSKKIAHNKDKRTKCENRYIARLTKRTAKNKKKLNK